MPESLQLPPVAQGILAITAVALAIVRLLTASRPFWASFPAWLQKSVPAVLMAIAALPTAIEHARSWLDIVVAIVVSGGLYWTASRGDTRPPVDKDGGPRIERSNTDPNVTPEEMLSRLSNEPPAKIRRWVHPSWRLAMTSGLVLLVGACPGNTPPPKAPCDAATLAAMTAACAAESYACGKNGGTESECTAECDRKLDDRAEECR